MKTILPPDGYTENDLRIMKRAVREEYQTPYHGKAAGPDWQAAIVGYLSYGGTDNDEVSDLLELFRIACEATGLEY